MLRVAVEHSNGRTTAPELLHGRARAGASYRRVSSSRDISLIPKSGSWGLRLLSVCEETGRRSLRP